MTRINLEWEKEARRKKSQSASWTAGSRCFPRGGANKNNIAAGFRLIDKTVAAGCNSFPYHWPSSRSDYRGRCTLRVRSSFHRLRSSRIERWLSSDRPRQRSESLACTRRRYGKWRSSAHATTRCIVRGPSTSAFDVLCESPALGTRLFVLAWVFLRKAQPQSCARRSSTAPRIRQTKVRVNPRIYSMTVC